MKKPQPNTIENLIFRMPQAMLCKEIKPEDLENYTKSNEWVAEQKLDGDRSLLVVNGDDVALFNRSQDSITYRYPEITEAIKTLGHESIILDGEMVVFVNGKDEFNEGISYRRGLKSESKIKARMITHPVTFMVFDILYLDGDQLVEKTLNERRAILAEIFETQKFNNRIRLVSQSTDLLTAWNNAKQKKHEGIIIKKISSQYYYGRSGNWLKVKFNKDAVLVFDGYEINPAGIKLIKTKTDPRDEIAVNLSKKPLHVQCAGYNAPPVKEQLDIAGEASVKVQYLSITKDNRLRMPSFKELIS